MVKAFKCERCGEYEEGRGRNMRVGNYIKVSGLVGHKYEWDEKAELCEDCYDKFVEIAESYMNP